VCAFRHEADPKNRQGPVKIVSLAAVGQAPPSATAHATSASLECYATPRVAYSRGTSIAILSILAKGGF